MTETSVIESKAEVDAARARLKHAIKLERTAERDERDVQIGTIFAQETGRKRRYVYNAVVGAAAVVGLTGAVFLASHFELRGDRDTGDIADDVADDINDKKNDAVQSLRERAIAALGGSQAADGIDVGDLPQSADEVKVYDLGAAICAGTKIDSTNTAQGPFVFHDILEDHKLGENGDAYPGMISVVDAIIAGTRGLNPELDLDKIGRQQYLQYVTCEPVTQ